MHPTAPDSSSDTDSADPQLTVNPMTPSTDDPNAQADSANPKTTETLMVPDEFDPPTERNPDVGTLCALDQAIARLGRDEQRVLTRIAERLAHGATTYGLLKLSSDPRSWKSQEARAEIEDALVYFACAWLKSEEVTP